MLRSLLLSTLALSLVATPAQAASVGDRQTVSAEVRYSMLNLTGQAGAAALDRLIARTARRICTGGHERTARDFANASRCRREAIASARPQRDLAIAAAMRRQRLAEAALAINSAR